MAMKKRGLFSAAAPTSTTNASSSSCLPTFLLAIFSLMVFVPLFFFVGNGLRVSASSDAIRLNLPSEGTKCISEEIQNNVAVVANYAVIDEDGPTISAKVTSPSGNMLYHQENVTHGQFAFTTSEIGNYMACFWVDGNHQSATLNIDWKIGGMAAQDAESVAKTKHIKAVENSISIKAQTDQRNRRRYPLLYDCEKCNRRKDPGTTVYTSPHGTGNLGVEDFDIMVTYSDSSGAIRVSSVKAKDLSSSWVWQTPTGYYRDYIKSSRKSEDSFQPLTRNVDSSEHHGKANETGEGAVLQTNISPIEPIKHHRQMLRRQRKELRTAELIRQDKEIDAQMEKAAIERSEGLDTTVTGKYSIWRRDYENPNSGSTLKLMRDQIIMAKAYATIAKAKNDSDLYDSLMKRTKKALLAIGEANSDAELQLGVLDQAKEMGHMLALAKDKLHDCVVLARKLRAMIQLTEDNVNSNRKHSAFLIQLAAKTIPKPLHCFSQLLTANYFLPDRAKNNVYPKEKLEDPSLYHYAIFSDNVLATAVVVNSTVWHANEPEKHVFHIVTDKLNVAAMKMWFLENPPSGASVEVMNVDDFKWLNSSYCIVLRQLETSRMKEFYFKVNNPSSLSTGADQLKYRNPKYLSMLNHLRFYLPEVYPKLDKILFLDDDIVVQKDLTPLWSIDMHGMVNGAVETCKESFHRFDKYLNFSNPLISENFDPNACGWAFGMNMFDLKEWKRRNITGIYHRWQELNEDRTLWKLGTLPPGLITFYNLTYPLDRSWHALGLGYDPALNRTQIENAAVVHYNGNYKPWLDLAITKYKSYWSRYVMYESPYLQICQITE